MNGLHTPGRSSADAIELPRGRRWPACGTLLVHADASAHTATRLEFARTLAADLAAQVRVLYAVTPTALGTPLATAEGLGSVLPLLMQADKDRRNAAHRVFDRVLRGVEGAAWADTGPQPVIAGFAQQALCADLLVLGQYDPSDPQGAGVPSDFVASVVIDSGRPALVLPATQPPGGGRVRQALVAWKPSREAAHALTGALPLLQQADVVHVVGGDVNGARPLSSALDLTDWLRSHGIDRQLRHQPPLDGDTGEELLSLAADLRVDLLVMGCYGHNRAREWALGGVTRTVLRSMNVPVLMAH